MSASVLIADGVFSGIAHLTASEQVSVLQFIRQFLANPAHPGLSLERLSRARSKGLWSGRISRDLRAILFKDGDVWAMVHADHHDEAYRWAERREVGRHRITGAIQVVESVETVREVERVIEVMVVPPTPPVFEAHGDDYLLSLGVPEEWLPTLRKVRNDDQLLTVCEKLPQDLAERLLGVADGELVTPPAPIRPEQPATEAADTQRRFYVVEDADGLAAALAAPLDRWISFLHPSQREMVERSFRGPSKVSGSAGTGKTVVAMHRARHLARQGERVLLTSYVTTLCANLERNLEKLCSPDERKLIQVSTVHSAALDIVRQVEPRVRPAGDDEVRAILRRLRTVFAPSYPDDFVEAEWFSVIRLQGLHSWAEYRRARRTGRGTPLGVPSRKALWKLFDAVFAELSGRDRYDWTGLAHRATEVLESGTTRSPFSAVIVDEVQDLRPAELRFLRATCSKTPGNLMLCGDAGQRIYPGGFSLSSLGIEVRGRSTVLRINYRTTEQIRRVADGLLAGDADDMDGGRERRDGTRSLLRGPQPLLAGHDTEGEELEAAVAHIQGLISSGLSPGAIAVFGPTRNVLDRVQDALSAAGRPSARLSDDAPLSVDQVQLGTMHRAKGLEFKAVLVVGCGAGSLPAPWLLRKQRDPADRDAVVEQQRRLLYVAMTRARDELRVSWTGAPSQFLVSLTDPAPGINA